ncbi:death-inducer obliterator 1 [Bacillus rossius redtenbacheri]|uniref:death-inducer obliterator 1 n=1 Tax=Bacillus rossius redtenbacheri TaxID=93214 RepID=UPI002FDD4EBE
MLEQRQSREAPWEGGERRSVAQERVWLQGRGRPRKDGGVSVPAVPRKEGTATPRGRGRGEGRRGRGRGRGQQPTGPAHHHLPQPRPLLLGNHLRPSLVPLLTPLVIAADESELRRNMTYRQAIIPVTDGKARLMALVPKSDEPRSEEGKTAEAKTAEAQPVKPQHFIPVSPEPVFNSTNQLTENADEELGVLDIVSAAEPVESPDRSAGLVSPEVKSPSEAPESGDAALAPEEAGVAPAVAGDSFTHVMQSVMRRRRGGGGRGSGPLKLRDYDSELEDALAFVTADLDRPFPLQLEPPSPPEPREAAPEKMDVRRTYKKRSVPGRLPSPEAQPAREAKQQVNNKAPAPPPLSPRPPAAPAAATAPGKPAQGHEGGPKRYPKRENRKAPAYLEKEFDSVLFSTPDIIRSVHSENTREQALTPEDRPGEPGPAAAGQETIPTDVPADASVEPPATIESGPGAAGGGEELQPPPPSPLLASPTSNPRPDPANPGRSRPDVPEPQPALEPTRGGKRGAKSASPSGVAGKKRKKSEDKKKQGKSRNRRQVQEPSDDEEGVNEHEGGDGSESEDDPDRLWCLCRKPHNNRFMIRCDGCEDWFHGTCVGVTEAEGHRMENRGIYWSCPKCSVMGSQASDPVVPALAKAASAPVAAKAAVAQAKVAQAPAQAKGAAQAQIPGKAAQASVLAKASLSPAGAKVSQTPTLVKVVQAPASVKTTQAPALAKADQAPALEKAAHVPVPAKIPQAAALAKTSQTPVHAKAAQAPIQAKAAQASVQAKNAQAPIQAKTTQAPVQAKAAKALVQAKSAQAPVQAKAAQAPVQAKAAQAPVQAKAAQAPVQAKATQAPVLAKAAQAPAVAKAAQAPVQAKAAQAPVQAKATQAPVQAKAAQAPVQAKAAQAPVLAKAAQAPAVAKAAQTPASAKPAAGSVPTGIMVSKREQMMARRQEAMLAQKSQAKSAKPLKVTPAKEKTESHDDAQPKKSPAVSPTANLFSVADPGASTAPATGKGAAAPRRELIFKVASSSEVSVRVYDKVTGKVLTGANAPKLSELKNWLEEHPTYEVAQRSLKPPPAKKEQQEVPTSPREKTPSAHRLILPKPPREGDEPPAKQRRESAQEKQQAKPVAKRQRRSSSVQNNKKHASEAEKEGGAKPAPGSGKKDQPQTGPAPKSGTPKKVDSKRSTSSEQDKDDEKDKGKGVPSGPEPIRQNVCRSLQELLLTRAKECSDLDAKEDDIQKIASSIEEEMYTLFRDTGLKYKAKYRSLVFNIKDPKNVTLYRKIVESLVTPYQLVRLTPEELASQELAQWREREVKHQLDMIKKTELDLLNNPKTYVVKTHKGEQEIEKEPTEFAAPVAIAEAPVSVDVVSSEGGLGFMEEEVVSVKEEVKHEKKDKHKHKDKKKHKKESKHRDREHKEKGEQHRHRDEQHRHRDGEYERKKSRDEDDRHRSKDKVDNEKKKSKDKDEHRHKESDHEKKRSKDKDEKQKHGEIEHEKKKIKSEEEQISNRESDKETFDEHVDVKDSIPDQEVGSNGFIKISGEKEVKDYQFFMNETNVDESLENFELKLEESIRAEMKFENENSSDILENIPSSSDVQRSFLSVASQPSAPSEVEMNEESGLFDRDSNSSLSTGKTKPDAQSSTRIVWSGYISMAGVSNVSTAAKLVYGNGKDLSDVLPTQLEVVGRIDPDTVWDYISKIKRSGTKEILVLRLTSSGGDAKVSYCTLYKHLHSKNRFGVIGNLPESTRIKDFYVMPLASHSPVPEQLTLLDGQILDGPRPHVLVCLIIRTIARQPLVFPETSQQAKSRVTPSPDPSTPPYPSLQEAQAQFSDDSEGANSDASSKRTSKVEAYVPKPVDGSKRTWKQIYPSASSNDSFAELSEGDPGVDGEDAPYSPGEDIDQTVELTSETKTAKDLQHTVDELDKIIDKRREEIKNISTAIGLTGAASVPELQLMSSAADTTTVADEDEAYSPSYSPPPREPVASNSSLPPTILNILRNIPKQGSSPSPQKKPKLADDSIVQSYGDKSNDSGEETPPHRPGDDRYSPSEEHYSPSDEAFSPADHRYSPSDHCYSPPNAASLTFLNDDPEALSLKEAYRRGDLSVSEQPLPPGSDSPPREALGKNPIPAAAMEQPLPPGVESQEFPGYGPTFAPAPPVMVPTGYPEARPPAFMYHTVTPAATLSPGPPMQFVVPPPSYPAPSMYPPLAAYPDTGAEERGYPQGRRRNHRQQRKGPWRVKERRKRFSRR